MENNNSNPSDPALPYLSDVIDVHSLVKGMINIIVAPCHSGKTTATSKIIEAHASCPERVLYLIDTTAGKDSLVTHHEAQRFRDMWLQNIRQEWWGERPDGNGFRVMTYNHFGKQVTQNNSALFEDVELIICDEMHNLIKYYNIEYGQNLQQHLYNTPNAITSYRDALTGLCSLARAKEYGPLVVALTATPQLLYDKLNDMKKSYRILDYTGRVRYDKTLQVHYYANLDDTLSKLSLDEKALIFINRIDMIKIYAEKLTEQGFHVGCLWGLHNEKHQMDEKQLAIRSVILKEEHIPDDINILFINAAYETSININNEDFNTMIVHNSNCDVQTQARGRLRHNINTLYLYDKKHLHVSQYFPEKYWGIVLTSDKTAEIADAMRIDNGNGRQMKWPSLAAALRKDGMTVQHFKQRGKQCWRVYPTSLTPVEQEGCA